MEALPEECLLHLISFIHDTSSRLTLLRTSRTLFRLIAPSLYTDPFRHLDASSPALSDRKLLRLLLACCPAHIHAPLLIRPRVTPPFADYLALYTHHSEKRLSNLLTSTFPDATRNHTGPRPHTLVHQALVGHTPHHIHTLSFFMHSIHILLPFVPALSSLVRLELSKKPDRQDIAAAQSFIAQHRVHFSSLCEIKIAIKNTSDTADYSCLIQAVGEPHLVDIAGWTHADRYLHQLPLQQCRVLLMRLSTPSPISSPDPAILTQCVHLRTVRMPAFHHDLFSWAKYSHSHLGLKSVSLSGLDSLLVPALTDACDGFRHTLRHLSGLSSFGDPSKDFLNWQWTMPHLVSLDLEGTVAAYFDLASLQHCPSLTDLRLNVGRKMPATWDPMAKVHQLAHVPHHLRRLELSGWWNLPDNALTGPLLPVLMRLDRLNLMWCTGPSVACYMLLIPQLRNLRWLGIDVPPQDQQAITDLVLAHHLTLYIDIPRHDYE
ncbi:hypothetical protein B0O80DRAFT_431770 [Mortierella sp. GBAus27b]|nr:hypothetical protein B0O80DRAFT_431770 [Mortierella sp. GBAus27b]